MVGLARLPEGPEKHSQTKNLQSHLSSQCVYRAMSFKLVEPDEDTEIRPVWVHVTDV